MTVFPSGNPGTGILGTGSYLPKRVVANQEVGARAGTTEEWIARKTAIRERRYAAPCEATSDLAANAARAALADAQIAVEDLAWIIVATSTPDQPQPATACLVQRQLGAHRAAAFDINSVCSGFVFALVTGVRLLSGSINGAQGCHGYGLVIGADVYSRIIDPTDRRTAILFGDGAGAVIIGPVRADRGFLGGSMASDGKLADIIRVEAGGSRTPVTAESLAAGSHYFKMDGRSVRDFVTRELPKAVNDMLRMHGIQGDEVDYFIPHQANGAMLEDVLPKLALDRARPIVTVAEHGNTSAASIPLAIDYARGSGMFADGDLLLLAGFGGGMSVGTALVRWDGQTGDPVIPPLR